MYSYSSSDTGDLKTQVELSLYACFLLVYLMYPLTVGVVNEPVDRYTHQSL